MVRLAKWAAVMAVLLIGAGMPASAEEPPAGGSLTAEDCTAAVEFAWNGSDFDASFLVDGSMSTKRATSAGDILSLDSAEPLGGVYLAFDRPTEAYTVTTGMEEIRVDTGFLHQWVPFSSETRHVDIQLPEGILCGISAWTAGEPPADRVQQWQPPYEDCDLLLLPTHADDDQLWFGAAMAIYADQGKKVQVAYLTNHWSEPYRPHELLNGLWQSGVRAYPIISDFPDYYSESLEHAKTLYDVDAMQAFLVSLLRRFRPEVVIGHDLDGEYGHGVHQLNAWLLTQALEQSGDASCFPESARQYGVFDVPKTYLHLYPERKLELEIDTPLANLGGRTAFETAQDGYACHVSQQQYWFKVFRSGEYSCRDFGLYRTTVGEDTGIGDLFEHITVYSDDPVEETPSKASGSQDASSLPAEEAVSRVEAVSSAVSDFSEPVSSQTQPNIEPAGIVSEWVWYAAAGLLTVLLLLAVLLGSRSRRN